MFKNRRVIAVVPAYNAERTICQVIGDMPDCVDEVLVVDDGSTDETRARALQAGVTVISHPRNMGYGASQKTCYRYAVEHGYDIAVMVHGDYQHDPAYIPAMIQPIVDGGNDFVLGNRMKTARNGCMPLYKIAGNHVHAFLMNTLLGTRIRDFATGYKAYRVSSLAAAPFSAFSNGFIFDEEMNVWAVRKGQSIINIDVPAKYFEDMSSVNWYTGLMYFFQTYWVILKSFFGRYFK